MTDRTAIEALLRAAGDDTFIEVWVIPGARRTEVTGVHDGALRIRVAAPAEHGRANEAVLRHLEAVTAATVRFEGGVRSRRKRVRVLNRSPAVVADTLVDHMTG